MTTAWVAWVDANVLLRVLTKEPPDLAGRARALMARVDRGDLLLLVPVVVIAEVVWVLASRYGYSNGEIAITLQPFVSADGIRVEGDEAVSEALALMSEKNVDFVDAYLAAVAAKRREPIATFDADFKRLGAQVLAI